MKRIFGSHICEDCVELFAYLDEKGRSYEFIDITANTTNLKEFLALRDHREEFAEVRKEGYIGIPAVCTEDGSILLGDAIWKAEGETND